MFLPSTLLPSFLLPMQADDFLRVYPPFVNFFEMSKETLAKCDRTYPRFHAFLKVSFTVCKLTQYLQLCIHNKGGLYMYMCKSA